MILVFVTEDEAKDFPTHAKVVVTTAEKIRAVETGGANVVAFRGGNSGAKTEYSALNGQLYEQIEAIEEVIILDAMKRTNNNQVQASKMLGIARGALQYRLKKMDKRKNGDTAETAATTQGEQEAA